MRSTGINIIFECCVQLGRAHKKSTKRKTKDQIIIQTHYYTGHRCRRQRRNPAAAEELKEPKEPKESANNWTDWWFENNALEWDGVWSGGVVQSAKPLHKIQFVVCNSHEYAELPSELKPLPSLSLLLLLLLQLTLKPTHFAVSQSVRQYITRPSLTTFSLPLAAQLARSVMLQLM